MGSPGGNPQIMENGQKIMSFCRNYCFWTPQSESYPTKVAIFDLERSRGPTCLGIPHHPILTEIPTHIQAFPNSWQPPMPPYGQIRSQTSGFMWSLLCKAPHLSPNPNFPVFQEVQVRPIILPYAIVCTSRSLVSLSLTSFSKSTDSRE